MNFAMSEDQLMVRDTARKFANDVVRPHAAEWDEAGELPSRVFHQLHEIGLMNPTAPFDDGGTELDAVSFVLALEEIARWDGSLALVVASHDAALSLTPERRSTMIERGEISSIVAAGVMTTAGGRVDRVVSSGGIFDLKEFEPEDAFGRVVERADVETLGMRAASLARVEIEGAPPSCWHTWAAAVAVGLARAALEDAAVYAQERQQFGKPISAYQAIQFKLADMATAIDAARLVVLAAAAGDPDASPVDALRLATEAALFVTDEAVQIHGGYGYVREYAVERYYRDARCFSMWVPA